MCVPVLKCRQLQGGFPPWPAQQWRKKWGPRALRIEVGHGHVAPFLIDMFVYRMITPYCTKFDRLTYRKFMEIVGTRGQISMAKCTKIDFGWGSAPDPAGGAYDAPPDSLVGWGGEYPLPIPYPTRRLWRLNPRAFGARLGACGASTPRSSRRRRSATSQRLKPTLLLPSGAATAISVDLPPNQWVGVFVLHKQVTYSHSG